MGEGIERMFERLSEMINEARLSDGEKYDILDSLDELKYCVDQEFNSVKRRK